MTADTHSDVRGRRAIRRRVRALRRELSDENRARAETAMLRHLRTLPAYRAARRIGSFRAFDGEPNMQTIVAEFVQKQFFVPVLRRDSLRFASWSTDTRWHPNRFGIDEPVGSKLIDPRELDLVLTPLVAFDKRGVRLGVGRGYYDHCFRFLRNREHWLHPKLLGVGFAFQEVEHLTAEHWDVPLWGIVTDDGATIFN